MAETLAINSCGAQIGWDLQNSTAWGNPADAPGNFSWAKTFASGTGAGKAQKLFVDQVTIAGSGNQSYDLSGSLTDPLGATVVFTNVKGLYIEHTTTAATGKLSVQGISLFSTGTTQLCILGTATSATDSIYVYPGGIFFWSAGTSATAGFTITNSSADVLKLVNGDAAAVVVKVVVWGE